MDLECSPPSGGTMELELPHFTGILRPVCSNNLTWKKKECLQLSSFKFSRQNFTSNTPIPFSPFAGHF